MNMGIIFVAGMYGVGKSTLCEKLSQRMNIPFYSAGDLISRVNGEQYGANKVVADKNRNQNILVEAVDKLLIHQPQIILAGHFCIFSAKNAIEHLPESVFHNLHIEKILLLQADVTTVQANLQHRDKKEYATSNLTALQETEQEIAHSIASQIPCSLVIHSMTFSDFDVDACLSLLG